jgi:hypothetical protein
MTVIADNKSRVTLPTRPGERFEVQAFGEDKFILTRLVPVEKIETVRLVRKHGYIVAVGTRRIAQAQVRKALDQFP